MPCLTKEESMAGLEIEDTTGGRKKGNVAQRSSHAGLVFQMTVNAA
jgi:hypothetical protein